MDVKIKVTGGIDEKNHLFSNHISEGDHLILDLEEVKIISSYGVKNWIQWFSGFPKKFQLTLQKCPLVIINQVNSVARFLPPGAIVESFMAPYDCANCGHEVRQLLQKGLDYDYPASASQPGKIMIPEFLTCKSCGEKMEPSFFQNKIFLFLK